MSKTIEEAKELKKETEQVILQAIQDFELLSGLRVGYIGQERANFLEGGSKMIEIKLEAYLT